MLDALKTHCGLLRKFFITFFLLFTLGLLSFHDFLSRFSTLS